MKNLEYIKYTYKHRKIVMKLAEKYFSNNETVLEQVRYHDLDKLYLYLLFDKKKVSTIHREVSSHHQNGLEKTTNDYIEMVLDWESARYTKPDKPLNAYDTLVNFYPELTDKILPILETLGIAESNLPADESILEFAQSLDDISEEEIMNELHNTLTVLTHTDSIDNKKLELK